MTHGAAALQQTTGQEHEPAGAQLRTSGLDLSQKVIGLDFDNTIVTYDAVFEAEAERLGLVQGTTGLGKRAVRDAIRLLPDGELAWQRLQGHVYGRGIAGATMFEGIGEFIGRARAAGCRLVIVSHKTQFGHFDPARTDLRQAALAWMTDRGFFRENGFGLRIEDVYFEETRSAKLKRIAALGCTHFIDDLEEVLSDPGFPDSVTRFLFSPTDPGRDRLPYPSYGAWCELADAIFPIAIMAPAGSEDGAAAATAARLIGRPVDEIIQVGGGRNSRVYRVRAGEDFFALKRYPVVRDDARDRLGAEVEALRLMASAGIDVVPRVIGFDRDGNFALLSWIEGSPVADVGPSDIDAALVFLGELHALGRASGVPVTRPAAEACLSGAEIERQIRTRLDHLASLEDEPQLRAFLMESLSPFLGSALSRARQAVTAAGLDWSVSLPLEKQSLVPSDFGFHNSLRRPDGSLAFLDFEYFGWDDPVKLTADILFHPGTPVGEAERRRFRAGTLAIYGGDAAFASRLDAYYPLFGLRWALILLNEFLPERWQRRVDAGEAASWPEAKTRQLQRAADLLGRIERESEAER